jgi:hypothetical protein
MFQHLLFFTLIFTVIALNLNNYHTKLNLYKEIKWRQLLTGLYYAEVKNPYYSKISDNIVSLVKANPYILDIDVYSCTSYDSIKRTAICWSQDFDLNVVVNAGMYNLINTYKAEGYLKSNNKINNSVFKESFKMFALFKSLDNPHLKPFIMIDAENDDIELYLNKYSSVFQSIRMIDCNGKQVTWKPKRLIYSSMCVLGIDEKDNLLIAFTRTPMSANQMSKLLLHLPLNIKSAMYLEGGPEACLYIKTPDTVILKKGSYVSLTFPTDTNTRLWNLPNVIGIKVK